MPPQESGKGSTLSHTNEHTESGSLKITIIEDNTEGNHFDVVKNVFKDNPSFGKPRKVKSEEVKIPSSPCFGTTKKAKTLSHKTQKTSRLLPTKEVSISSRRSAMCNSSSSLSQNLDKTFEE